MYTSNVEWPKEVCTGRSPNVSTDRHYSWEAAKIVCDTLEVEGLGCEGKIFPIRTWVEKSE